MNDPPALKFLSKEEIIGFANDFLDNRHPSRELPIPIEEIIEFKLGIDIIPVPDLKNCFEEADLLDIDAYISSDFKSISVDKYVHEKRENRYRFSLAHEIGHMILHKDFYNYYEFNSIKEWIETINEIAEKTKKWVEFQAREFAGLVLVPTDILKDKYPKAIEEAKRIIDNNDEIEIGKELINYIAYNLLGKEFVVSRNVIEKRLRKDGLII